MKSADYINARNIVHKKPRNFFKRLGEILFSNRKWYRKSIGGVWHYVTPVSFPEITVWCKDVDSRFEKINKTEYYLK